MPITPIKWVGDGRIYDATNGVCLSNQAEFSVTSNVEELAIASGVGFGEGYIPTKQTYGGRLACRDFSPDLVAAIIGGSTATGALKHISKEAVTIPTTPFAVALANAAELYTPSGCTYPPIVVQDSDGVVYEQVASSPATGQFFNTAGTLTFAAADVAKVLAVSYWYLDADGGVTVSPSVTTIPGAMKYLFSGYGYSTLQGTNKGFITVYVAKLQRTGEVSFGATVGDAGTISFDYRAIVDVTTDLAIGFENK